MVERQEGLEELEVWSVNNNLAVANLTIRGTFSGCFEYLTLGRLDRTLPGKATDYLNGEKDISSISG